jgi:homoserine O-acetyltransferase
MNDANSKPVADLIEQGSAPVYDGLVEKRVFELPTPLVTVGGATINQVRVGYETIGRLNAAADNAILIPHFFSGTSHFAGRYRPTDPLAGYWDAIVGPGKPLDTDRFFLIGVDTLANVNALDGTTVTTGPATLDPITGRPYGMWFPLVQIRDSVEVQKALLDHLGIQRLYAVMGASMGSMQGYEWAASYPERVDRLVAVVPCASVDALSLARLRDLVAAIRLDPKWSGGDYYDKERPVDGLMLAARILNWLSLAPAACDAYGRKWADPAQDPATAMAHTYAIQLYLSTLAEASAQVVDANSLIYTVRANELFTVGGKESLEEGLRPIRAKTLLIPAKHDNLAMPEQTRKVRDLLRAQGNRVEYFELNGPFGHLDGAFSITQASDVISEFLKT